MITRRRSDIAGTPAPAPARSGRGLAVAILFVILFSSFVVLAFTKDDGASTSVQATLDMIAAIEANDFLGVLEQLPPGERKVLKEGAVSLAAQLRQVGLSSADDLQHIDGPRIDHSALVLRSSGLSKDMDAVDIVGGSMVLQMRAGDAPLTPEARDDLEKYAKVRLDAGGESFSRDLAVDPLRLIAIHEGGGWHVSLAYSIAESLRSSAGVEFPKMGMGPQAIGANTPDEVIRDLMKAYAGADAERLVALTYPDEARALYDYSPSFLPRARDLSAAAAAGHTYSVQVNDLKTSVDGSGSFRTVRVTAFDIDIRDELKKTHLTYEGRCLHLDHRIADDADPYERWDRCDNDPSKPGDSALPLQNPIVGLSIFGGGVDLPAFAVIERGGRWFLSPTRTILDSIVSSMSGRSAEMVDAFVKRLSDSFRAGSGDGLTGHPIEPAARPAGSAPQDDTAKAVAKSKALLEGCAGLVAGPNARAVADACVKLLVATNRIDKASIPPS